MNQEWLAVTRKGQRNGRIERLKWRIAKRRAAQKVWLAKWRGKAVKERQLAVGNRQPE